MTDLTRRALATVPLSCETVEDFFDGSASGSTKECLRALCISHERLRSELQGAEILIAEDSERIKRLEGFKEILRTLLDKNEPLEAFHEAVRAVIDRK